MIEKNYICLYLYELNTLEQKTKDKLDLLRSQEITDRCKIVEAKAFLTIIDWIKSNNVYNRDFKYKN